MSDPVLHEARAEISAIDRALLDLVNRRFEIVRRLHEHKTEQGLPFRDHAREQQLLDDLTAANPGPSPDRVVRSFFQHVIDLIQEEIHGE